MSSSLNSPPSPSWWDGISGVIPEVGGENWGLNKKDRKENRFLIAMTQICVMQVAIYESCSMEKKCIRERGIGEMQRILGMIDLLTDQLYFQ